MTSLILLLLLTLIQPLLQPVLITLMLFSAISGFQAASTPVFPDEPTAVETAGPQQK